MDKTRANGELARLSVLLQEGTTGNDTLMGVSGLTRYVELQFVRDCDIDGNEEPNG